MVSNFRLSRNNLKKHGVSSFRLSRNLADVRGSVSRRVCMRAMGLFVHCGSETTELVCFILDKASGVATQSPAVQPRRF